MRYLTTISTGLKSERDMTLSGWSDEYRFSSQEEAKENMECLPIRSPVLEVVWVKPTQIGSTSFPVNLFFRLAVFLFK